MDIAKPKARVNASMLPKYHGQGVCLLGIAQQTDQSGMSFQMKAADSQSVTVNMQEPITEYVNGLVEVHGVVQPNNTIICHNYVIFTPENAEEFDLELYNKTLMLMNQHPDNYILQNNS